MMYIAIAGGLLPGRESRQRGKKVVEAFIHKPPCPCMGEELSPEKGER
jgi:plastocyanin domain-containing protein